jgi:putative endonuclease
MIRGMKTQEKDDPWHLYILECQDRSFYTGITKDLERRLNEHNQGRASRYTRTRRPVRLCYQEQCSGRAQALVRECQVKALSRAQKEQLVRG